MYIYTSSYCTPISLHLSLSLHISIYIMKLILALLLAQCVGNCFFRVCITRYTASGQGHRHMVLRPTWRSSRPAPYLLFTFISDSYSTIAGRIGSTSNLVSFSMSGGSTNIHKVGMYILWLYIYTHDILGCCMFYRIFSITYKLMCICMFVYVLFRWCFAGWPCGNRYVLYTNTIEK